ncbi:HD1 homeodomain transcription factor mating type protein [Heterobasidion irregulare TC 32-1]|uniref:HD1 homeodomain transcription factor mating type protein n=1 Tax=Heterobasidion irregulare (strain TC 32-1) TaxID=747525 RepID=W4KNR5_HETIT|nr:HD1 homeodomain transcription factor mating type protein [Heterobasidion irregulare TC 32-1]ETW87030.1 HD1 homeodomain transcription factor mating type protein [Heterobasidion irregulare TC 32-1]
MPQHPLYHRLQQAQSAILSSASGGPAALLDFQKSWQELTNDLDREVRLHRVDDAVITMAQSTASIVSTLASSFLSLDNCANDIFTNLSKDLEDTLDNSRLPSSTDLIPTEAVYSWLLANLHYPYPSASMKKELAASCGTTVEYIASLFNDTRERIGWTTLARHRFESKRSSIIDAAYRALVTPDPTRPLPLDLENAFAIIKKNLEAIQIHNNATSLAITDIDDDRAEGWSAEIYDGQAVREELARGLGGADQKSDLTLGDSRAVLGSSPCLSPLEWYETEEEDTTLPQPIAGCKRRADVDLETDFTPCSSNRNRISYRSLKRQRSEPPSADNQVLSSPVLTVTGVQASHVKPAISSIPSPDSSPSMLLEGSSIPTSSSSLAIQSSSPPLAAVPSRKRRLSEASCDSIPKRPRHIRNGHHMQTVSNPLPLGPNEIAQDSALFESWYQNVTYAASEPFGGDPSSDCSPATSILNTPWTDGLPVFPNDFMVPSQQVDLSDEDFKAMLASGYNMSSMFMPIDQDIFETLPSLDDLFPPSCSGIETLIQQPAQYMIDLGLQAVSTSQIEECQAQSSSIPTFLSYDHPRQILLSPLKKIDSPISDTLIQCTSLCGIGEDSLDNWTAGVLGWKDTNLSAQM